MPTRYYRQPGRGVRLCSRTCACPCGACSKCARPHGSKAAAQPCRLARSPGIPSSRRRPAGARGGVELVTRFLQKGGSKAGQGWVGGGVGGVLEGSSARRPAPAEQDREKRQDGGAHLWARRRQGDEALRQRASWCSAGGSARSYLWWSRCSARASSSSLALQLWSGLVARSRPA